MRRLMRRMRGVRFRAGIVLCAFLVLIVVTYRLWIPWPGRFLTVKDHVEKADCIVVLQGEPYYRFRRGADPCR